MFRRVAVLVSLALTVVSALPTISSAQTAASCPAEPARAIAVAFGSGFYRTDLQQAALTAVSAAAQQAGLTVVAPQANVLQSIPGAQSAMPFPAPAAGFGAPQPATLCVPTLVLVVNTGMPSAFTLVVSRYSEQVAVGAVLALPNNQIFQATSQQNAAWYNGYLPTPYIPNLPVYVGGIQVGTPQASAEQSAAQRGVTSVLATLLPKVTVP